MSSSAPIGVFDSGIGGTTVVKELMASLPNEKIIYFGDTARVPYGNKSAGTVIMYSRQIVRFLLEKKVKAIVIACNTASALALDALKSELEIPIIGVVKPGAKAAAEVTKCNKIGVIGTRATINSGIYKEFLHKTNPDIQVFGKACPLFVPLVEEGWISDDITRQVIHRYLDELVEKEIDALVLGCTHYPILAGEIGKITGEGITLVNPAFECAKEFRYLLEENDLLCEEERIPEHEFYVSDGPKACAELAESFLGEGIVKRTNVAVHNFENEDSDIKTYQIKRRG
ncbi:MAG: glutamate racemase [Lachnospiraceae bacterium]|nr:glutamate racemase [Lachnospiraceae bacterium]